MTTGHVFVATSLDGFIARNNHALDWLPQEKIEVKTTVTKPLSQSMQEAYLELQEFFQNHVLVV